MIKPNSILHKMKKKLFTIGIVSCALVALVLFTGCTDVQSGERAKMLNSQPTETIQHSVERDIFTGYLKECSDSNNIQWIYCMNQMGGVAFKSPVKGKTISATKSTEPYERIVMDSSSYSDEDLAAQSFAGFIPGTTQLMNPSGMFGHDTEGVIWMDPMGNYYEWHSGPYFVSSVPLKLDGSSLTMNIDYDLSMKEKAVESGSANISTLY